MCLDVEPGRRNDRGRTVRSSIMTSMKHTFAALAISAMILGMRSSASPVSAASEDEPQFTSEGELMRPTNYREWIFVTSGIGMTYDQGGREIGAAANQTFTNVYVTPASYRGFMKTGHW